MTNPDTSETTGQFGFSLGFDGLHLVVGAPKADGATNGGNQQGEVYVFSYNNKTDEIVFEEILNHPDPAQGNEFGFSVSTRNYTIAVGSPFEQTDSGGGNAGTVLVFAKPPPPADDQEEGAAVTTETYQFQEQLVPDETAGGDNFGSQAYLDYTRVVASAPVKNVAGLSGANSGGAWSFDQQESEENANDIVWQQTGFFAPSDLAGNDRFGSSMVVQANYLAVGAEYHEGAIGSEAGGVYAFYYNTTKESWEALQKIVPAETVAGDRVGSAVGLYCDSLFVGAPGDANDQGTVYWYQRNEELAAEIGCNDDPVPVRDCWWDLFGIFCDPYDCGWDILCHIWNWLFPVEQPEPCPPVFDPCVTPAVE